jgi:menaquinone-dependent protoporphyrinogen oxidase
MVTDKVLVAYATRYGSTKEIAEEIAQVLSESGVAAEVANVMDVDLLEGYGAAIIGSPIYMGKCLPEAVDFVRQFQTPLRHIPVALFVVGFSMKEPTEENRRHALASIEAIKPYLHPLDVGIFSGKMVIEDLEVPDRQIVTMAGEVGGDFRDWDEIAGWAGGLITVFAKR